MSVEGIHGADAAEFNATGEGEVGFDQADDGFGAGATEQSWDGLLRIESDTDGPCDLRAFREIAVVGVAEGVAAMEWVQG